MASWRSLIGWMSQERRGRALADRGTAPGQAGGGAGPGAARLGRGESWCSAPEMLKRNHARKHQRLLPIRAINMSCDTRTVPGDGREGTFSTIHLNRLICLVSRSGPHSPFSKSPFSKHLNTSQVPPHVRHSASPPESARVPSSGTSAPHLMGSSPPQSFFPSHLDAPRPSAGPPVDEEGGHEGLVQSAKQALGGSTVSLGPIPWRRWQQQVLR